MALRALHIGAALKASTTVKGLFNGIFDLIEKFYDEQLTKAKFAEGRSWTQEQKQNRRLENLCNLFKVGINEEIPGRWK